MKIVIFEQYVPDPCGAFFHDIAIAKELMRRGHNVHFVTVKRNNSPIRGQYRGISWTFYTNAENEMRGANIWMSPHYPFLKTVRRLNETFNKPLVVTMHFGENVDSVQPYSRSGKWAEFLWIISKHITEHIQKTVQISPTFKCVETVRPIMIENEIKMHERGTLPKGEYITLINANLMKGLGLFIECAVKFPNKKFLGVRPYYNGVPVPEKIPNIKWINICDDIREVLRETRVLMVPSLYESWGRVAFEAMYNGIPVIHSLPIDPASKHARPSGSTEGMNEWIQGTQSACDYSVLQQWFDAIEKLDDEDTYKDYSERAYQRSYEMNCFQDIQSVQQKLTDYSIQFASKDDDEGSKSKQVAPQLPAYAQVPKMGNAMPFRGGRFVVRR